MIPVIYVDEEASSEAMASKFEVMKSFGVEIRPVVHVVDVLPTLHRERDVALVILDIIMPPQLVYTLDETNGGTRTGIRLLRDIRREFPVLPVVLVSVMPREGSTEAIQKYQVAEYLTKPVSGEALAAVVKRVLGKETAFDGNL